MSILSTFPQLPASISSLQGHLPPALVPFVSLSYPIAATGTFHAPSGNHTHDARAVTLYDKGPLDAYFVLTCAVFFTILREVVVRCMFRSFARSWLRSNAERARLKEGKRRRESKSERRAREHVVTRFSEQGWSFIYCTLFWSLGMVSTFSYRRNRGG
jgi:acyl-CoA-dependent ceramide synthase